MTSGERNEGRNLLAMTAKTAMTSTQSWMTSFYRRKDSVPADINSPEMTKPIAIKRRQLVNIKRGSTAPAASNQRHQIKSPERAQNSELEASIKIFKQSQGFTEEDQRSLEDLK